MNEIKTYISDKPQMTLIVKVGVMMETLFFSAGRLTTDDNNQQDAIEASELFRSGHIRIAPPVDPRVALANAVTDLSAVAKQSAAFAAKAQAAVDAFLNGPKAAKAQADKDAAAVDAAVKALADYDKAKAAPAVAPAAPAPAAA